MQLCCWACMCTWVAHPIVIWSNYKYACTFTNAKLCIISWLSISKITKHSNNKYDWRLFSVFMQFQDATSDHGPHMLTLRVPSITTLEGGSRIRQKRSGPHGTDSQEARPTINMEITLLKTVKLYIHALSLHAQMHIWWILPMHNIIILYILCIFIWIFVGNCHGFGWYLAFCYLPCIKVYSKHSICVTVRLAVYYSPMSSSLLPYKWYKQNKSRE